MLFEEGFKLFRLVKFVSYWHPSEWRYKTLTSVAEKTSQPSDGIRLPLGKQLEVKNGTSPRFPLLSPSLPLPLSRQGRVWVDRTALRFASSRLFPRPLPSPLLALARSFGRPWPTPTRHEMRHVNSGVACCSLGASARTK